MDRKVYIMTSEESFHNNYGALFQGFALNMIIKSFGWDVSIIRYRGQPEPVKNTLIKNPVTRLIKKTVKTIFPDKVIHFYKRDIKRQRDGFIAFQEKYMDFYNEKQTTFKRLKKNYPDAYAYVCGSDQIWNPAFRGGKCEEGYYLSFVRDGIKKIAYAPSLGVNKMPQSAADDFIKYINRFDFVSVREQRGAEIIKELVGKDVPVLLDPTLVYEREQWKAMAKPVDGLPDKYILVYQFARGNCLEESVCEISKKYALPVISVPLSKVALESKFDKIFASPEEFIYLIKNAQLVCTDSFHASVFSIITETPFLTFLRENLTREINMNSRVENLLNMVNLQDRMVKKQTDICYDDLFDMDFSKAHLIIDEKKQDALNYLANALES